MEQERVNISEPAKGAKDFLIIKGGLQTELPFERKPIYPLLINFLGGKELAAHSLTYPLDELINKLLKRTADIFLSSVFIVGVLSWLIPLMAIAVKMDSRGPVFFFQKRNKRNGREFTCIKFRSMINNQDADTLPATADDLRITRLGKFLRKNYLDEIPQFFNVWWGDMSLIGPRPHMLYDNMKYTDLIEYYDYRHKVKPGITGLAQVLGYVGETTNIQNMRDRVQLDLFYVRHWTFFLDLKIMLHTVFKFF